MVLLTKFRLDSACRDTELSKEHLIQFKNLNCDKQAKSNADKSKTFTMYTYPCYLFVGPTIVPPAATRKLHKGTIGIISSTFSGNTQATQIYTNINLFGFHNVFFCHICIKWRRPQSTFRQMEGIWTQHARNLKNKSESEKLTCPIAVQDDKSFLKIILLSFLLRSYIKSWIARHLREGFGPKTCKMKGFGLKLHVDLTSHQIWHISV